MARLLERAKQTVGEEGLQIAWSDDLKECQLGEHVFRFEEYEPPETEGDGDDEDEPDMGNRCDQCAAYDDWDGTPFERINLCAVFPPCEGQYPVGNGYGYFVVKERKKIGCCRGALFL
jgi:hypothetical protein